MTACDYRDRVKLTIDLEEKNCFTPLVNNFSKNSIEERIVSVMKIKKKSIMTIILATLLVFGTTTVFTTSAFAANNEKTQVETDEETDESDIPHTNIESTSVKNTNIAAGIDEEGISEGIVPLNANIQETRNLPKGKSKTYSFNVNGGWFNPDHNAVSVVISLESGQKYQYISENVTQSKELANVRYAGNASRTLSNLVPGDKYEITIINLGISDLKYTISITSYIK